MTLRPQGCREPTDAEMQCLPEGAIWLNGYKWEPSNLIGKEVVWTKQDYAVPIMQELKQEPQKTLRDEFAMAALVLAAADEGKCPCAAEGEITYNAIACRAYLYADAMLAARNQTN